MSICLIVIPLNSLWPVPPTTETMFYEAKENEKLLSVYRDDENLTITIEVKP